jgi:hypothetical protein
MAKLTDVLIGVGTTANDKKGDSLRAAFQKVNVGFTDLYTKLGLVDGSGLNLGAFTFTGSTMSTDDSTAITIDKPITVNGEIIADGDITPKTNLGASLGTPIQQFKSLYVSNIATANYQWSFDNAGRTIFPNGTVPEHSYGAAGDKEGMVVFSDPYIYYCKQDYVNNTTDIWVRVAWTGTSW